MQVKVNRRFWKFSTVEKAFKVKKDFPYDVKLRLLAHSRSFLANQKVRNAIVGAENLLKYISRRLQDRYLDFTYFFISATLLSVLLLS